MNLLHCRACGGIFDAPNGQGPSGACPVCFLDAGDRQRQQRVRKFAYRCPCGKRNVATDSGQRPLIAPCGTCGRRLRLKVT